MSHKIPAEGFPVMHSMVKSNDESGQAITEYIMMVVLFLGLTLMLVTLLGAFYDYGWRVLGLVGMDYP